MLLENSEMADINRQVHFRKNTSQNSLQVGDSHSS